MRVRPERELMTDALTTSLEQLMQICGSIDSEQANRKTSPDRWSASEVVEHLAIAETAAWVTIQRRLNQPAATAEEVAATAGLDTILQERIAVANQKIQAPESVTPTGRYGEWPAPLKALEKVRHKVIQIAARNSPDFDTRTVPHPILGPMTIRQWLVFIDAHTRRHLPQLRDCLQS